FEFLEVGLVHVKAIFLFKFSFCAILNFSKVSLMTQN
ncbi:MAG: hypothetical protein ACI85G_001319, partial [Psychroserpens sp.]